MFSFPFPIPKVGNLIFHSHSQSQNLRIIFFIPIPNPKNWEKAGPFVIPNPKCQKSHSCSCLPSTTEEELFMKSPQEQFESIDLLEEGESVREEVRMEDIDMADGEICDRFNNSIIEWKWSLKSGFSIGSKSSRSSVWSRSSNGSKWSFGSSLSLARSTIHGDVKCIINDLSLHSHFLYWPILALFISIILTMVVFTVLTVIFS